MSPKQANNNKLQDSVATYLRCGGVVNNQIMKGLLPSLRVKKNSSCLAVCWPGVQSAQDNHVLACNFAKYSPI